MRPPVRSAHIWLALVVVAAAVSAVAGDRAQLRGDRDPLAVQLNAIEAPAWTRPHARRDRGSVLDEAILRAPPDSLVAALMDSTSLANITATIQRLQDFGSRYVVVDSCWAAGYWIRDRFADYGYSEVRLDTFRTWTFQDTVPAMNVLAFKEGETRPSEFVVLGGHYDSVTTDNFADPDAPAPGAEDNATAVAAVLEAARLLRDVPTDRSIIFACWSAEEEGLWGSRDFVARAVEESLDIVLYLNMDCIGYLDPEVEGPPVVVFSDSLSFAVSGYMQTLAGAHTDYALQTIVRPFGASDHTSFWEAGYNVIDTGTTVSSPYRHTQQDVIDNIEPAFARDIAAINVAATAAVAGVVAEDPNLPPETVRIESCTASHSVVTMRPVFEWDGVDFDGDIAGYEYALEQAVDRDGEARGVQEVGRHAPRASGWTATASREWQPLPAEQTSIRLEGLDEATYRLRVRAVDDEGAADPLPLAYTFTTDASFRPLVRVETNFLPVPRVFEGGPEGARTPPVAVYENERLVFELTSDASAYCGRADSVSFAVGDTFSWSAWYEVPYELVLRPGPLDTVVHVRTRDENLAVTAGSISLRPVPARMDRPLLHVDDWWNWGPTENEHDAFYASVLSRESCDVWDPIEHPVDYMPTLPPMDELGRYRTVLWTLDGRGGFLRAVQAESTYHYVEGFVRAGGNLILEGQSCLTSFGGGDLFSYRREYGPGDFIFDHVGVDSLFNAGANYNPSYPTTYGYAFMGGVAADDRVGDVPVDTLVRWADGHAAYGGLPYCEIVRPRDETRRLLLFDSYVNPTLADRPCATIRHADDGTGSVAYFGFPLYYAETGPALNALAEVLDRLKSWQEPSELVHFDWRAEPDSTVFEWYLGPAGAVQGCSLERSDHSGQEFRALNDASIEADDNARFRFVDTGVERFRTYAYRLLVVEQWGGTTTLGPWEVTTLADDASPWLSASRPNPFRYGTAVRYGVGADHRWVSVGVYDVAGRLVRTLREGPAAAGTYDASWDGTDREGRGVASGVYFIRVRVGDESLARKVVLLR